MKRPIMSMLILVLIAGATVFWAQTADSAPGAQPQPPTPYKCYVITNTVPPPVAPQELVTALGVEEGVAVLPAQFLCEPALKILPDGGSEGDLSQTPYKVYMIADTHDPGAVVDLETQFGIEEDVAVGPAQFLWQAALKNGVGDLSQTPYKCYQISDPPPDYPPVQLVTQFGVEEMVIVGPAQFLCEPALENGFGDLSASPYKCYQIEDPAPQVPPVELVTQFPPEPPIVEPGVEVGPAAFLCDPAVRTVTSPFVGGLAELPDAAGDSGWPAGAYAALAGAIAAAVLALGGGAWYARRRLS